MIITKDKVTFVDLYCCPYVIQIVWNEDLCIKCVVKSKSVHTSEKQKLLPVVKLHILSLRGWIRPVIYSVQRWPFKCSWHLGNCPFCSPISFYFTAFFLLNAISPFSVHLHLVDLSSFHFSFPVSSSSTTLRLLVGKISFFSFSVHIPCQVLLKCWSVALFCYKSKALSAVAAF